MERNNHLIFGSGVSSFKDVEGLTQMCSMAVDYGIMAFDTAPSYRTEIILGEALQNILKTKGISRERLHIQTKIDPIQMYNGHVEDYFKLKLQEMHLDYVDVLLIHWPVYKYFMRTWEEMLAMQAHGLTKRIGICNLRLPHLKELKCIGIVPEVLQIERHPLNTFQSEVAFCHENGITLQDYSPLCKMHPLLRDNKMLHDMANRYGKSVGSVILRWHIDTGATPIFTSKRPERIRDYADVDSFKLTKADCDSIASLNMNHKLYLESLVCPGF